MGKKYPDLYMHLQNMEMWVLKVLKVVVVWGFRLLFYFILLLRFPPILL